MMTLAECRGDSANEPIHSLPLLPRGGSHLKQQADLFPARHRGMAAALHTIRGSSIKLETAWPEQQKMHPTKKGLPAVARASRARLLAEEFRKFSMTAYSKTGPYTIQWLWPMPEEHRYHRSPRGGSHSEAASRYFPICQRSIAAVFTHHANIADCSARLVLQWP